MPLYIGVFAKSFHENFPEIFVTNILQKRKVSFQKLSSKSYVSEIISIYITVIYKVGSKTNAQSNYLQNEQKIEKIF
jgi:transcription elongation factor